MFIPNPNPTQKPNLLTQKFCVTAISKSCNKFKCKGFMPAMLHANQAYLKLRASFSFEGQIISTKPMDKALDNPVVAPPTEP